ncbi:GNAT family N-acetyltransferase [Limnovirga soli]|uniref:GNAT family N-acetyltransferase n=1 Tax=Limnovirga soli TaxID=2656915 RepID=A0A8J8FDS4_9BACT|nr:GNAT family N-acetyltransferase [Limnovirga soli]NNV54076.1 GNAT family N-acetyltransferase [Limnovirga soli]
MLQLLKTDSSNTDFKLLVQLLDADLAKRDGDDHQFYAQFNYIDAIKHVIVAYVNNIPVACGAFKPYTDTAVEIKRMYVAETYRGQGFAQKVLAALEQWAAVLNNTSCVLETGKKQPEAIALYQKAGYTQIKNYGQYEHVENSVCMEKKIG